MMVEQEKQARAAKEREGERERRERERAGRAALEEIWREDTKLHRKLHTMT